MTQQPMLRIEVGARCVAQIKWASARTSAQAADPQLNEMVRKGRFRRKEAALKRPGGAARAGSPRRLCGAGFGVLAPGPAATGFVILIRTPATRLVLVDESGRAPRLADLARGQLGSRKHAVQAAAAYTARLCPAMHGRACFLAADFDVDHGCAWSCARTRQPRRRRPATARTGPRWMSSAADPTSSPSRAH